MLTKTSETAILALLFLEKSGGDTPVSPGHIAERLGASPTYLAKVCTALTKAGLLRAHYGMRGGVTLARPASEITLLAIVEACQGKLLGDYCVEFDKLEWVCGFHAAMNDLHLAIVGALSRWTLADLAAKPGPSSELEGKVNCRLGCLQHALACAETKTSAE
ncbi:MAG: Rrf2 family transcriptional regulator [FCB group bacterium]|jgi:Rrf2 family protein|nr:Rrf2 family transcriptional regulator [FCB group bacterium]